MVTNISDYGKTIKCRLVEMDKPQKWLIDEVANKTGLYFDSSYLHKVMTGKVQTPKVVEAINEILAL